MGSGGMFAVHRRSRPSASGLDPEAVHVGVFALATVEEIASAHGWDIRVTASADGGARSELRGVATSSIPTPD